LAYLVDGEKVRPDEDWLVCTKGARVGDGVVGYLADIFRGNEGYLALWYNGLERV